MCFNDIICDMAKGKMVTLARILRRNQTEAEGLLWSKIRSSQLSGYKFRRQFPVENYILDFYCPSARLAIEIDGGQHGDTESEIFDELRTKFLAEKGIRVIRFWNHEVIKNLEDVVQEILANMP